jgi:uncharacterized membrane protein
MDLIARVTLAATVLATGLMAGLYFAYTFSVMPGLAGASDRTLVETMQRINVAILNGAFGVAFGGAVVCGIAAVVMHLLPAARASSAPAVLPWLVVGVLLYAATLVVTFVVNVPLNDALAAAGDPARLSDADLASVRAAFESRWVFGNGLRTLASSGGFACLLVAITR